MLSTINYAHELLGSNFQADISNQITVSSIYNWLDGKGQSDWWNWWLNPKYCVYMSLVINALSTLYVSNTDLIEFQLYPLSTNFTKWSNTLKPFVGNLPTNCLSVSDHFVGLALKGFRIILRIIFFQKKYPSLYIKAIIGQK